MSKILDRPLPEIGIRPVVAFEVGGTTPAVESIESETCALNYACVEPRGISKMTHECVPGGFKGLCLIPAPYFWEDGGTLCVDSP